METGAVLSNVFGAFVPVVPWLVGLGVLWIVLASPWPGRGPRYPRRRDGWRTFRFDAREAVLERAGRRCERGKALPWQRCGQPAEDIGHVYPWTQGGATIVSNARALCHEHDRSTRDASPPWWSVRALEWRRRSYAPAGSDIRVRGAMTQTELDERAAWAERQRARLEQASEPVERN